MGRSASDLKHPVSGPTVDTGQQANKLEELKKETPVCQDTRGAGKRTNPRLRPQEPPKPPPPEHTQPHKEQPPSRKQSEGHSHTPEGREAQQGLSNQDVKSQGNKEPLPKKLSPPEPGENTPPEQNAHQTMVKDGKSKETGLAPSGSEPCAEARGSSVAESSPVVGGTNRGLREAETPAAASGRVDKEESSPVVGGTPLGLQEVETQAPASVRVAEEESSPVVGGKTLGLRETETPAPASGRVAREVLSPVVGGTPQGLWEAETPPPASGRVAEEGPIPPLAAGTLVAQEVVALPAAHSNKGKEPAAGEALSRDQLLPPVSKATETKKADGSVPQEEFPESSSGQESAKQVPVLPQRKEGAEQTAAAPKQEPAAPSSTFERGTEVQPQAPLVLPSPEKPQEMTLEEKMQHKNLVSSLKSYLLLLLKMSDSSNSDTKEDAEPRAEEQPTAEEAALPEIGIAGLSPRTSRRVLEKVQNNQLFQTAENLPLTPRTTRRITGLIQEEFVTSKEMLACRPVPPKRRTKVAPEAEGSSQLSVPSIVVGSMPAAGAGQPPNTAPILPQVSPEKESPSDPLAALPCATPEELASGARRKIYLPKTKQAGEEEEATPESQGHARSPTVSPRQSRKSAALLQTPALAPSPPAEQRSPTLMKKMATLEVPKLYDEPAGDSSNDPEVPEDAKLEGQPAESKKANNPFKGKERGNPHEADFPVAYEGSLANQAGESQLGTCEFCAFAGFSTLSFVRVKAQSVLQVFAKSDVAG